MTITYENDYQTYQCHCCESEFVFFSDDGELEFCPLCGEEISVEFDEDDTLDLFDEDQ